MEIDEFLTKLSDEFLTMLGDEFFIILKWIILNMLSQQKSDLLGSEISNKFSIMLNDEIMIFILVTWT